MGVFRSAQNPCNRLKGFGCGGWILNHRPLGYEFNTWSWMGIIAPSDQQHTCSTYLLVLVGSGSLVSILLALFEARPPRRGVGFWWAGMGRRAS
jgi:hypothetical protein